jgi:hypothetical protein
MLTYTGHDDQFMVSTSVCHVYNLNTIGRASHQLHLTTIGDFTLLYQSGGFSS